MSASWPSDLPQSFILDGLGGEEPDILLREDMDAGPAKVRPRYTAAAEVISGKILLEDSAALDRLRVFYRSTLRHGALPFSWLDPRDMLPGMFRFYGGYKWEPWEGRWIVSFQVEKLPL